MEAQKWVSECPKQVLRVAETGQAMHIKWNIVALSGLSSLQLKNIITYFEWVYVVFGIQHAMRMRHIVICVLPGSTIFFHIIS